MASREVGSPVRPVLEAIVLVVVAFVVSIVVGVVFAVPLVVLNYDIGSTFGLVGLVAAGQVGMLLVALAYVYWRDVTVPVEVPDRSDLVAMVVGTVLALVVAVALSFLLATLDLVPDSVIGDVAAEDPTFLLALAGLTVVLVAPTEELLFRGAIQGRFRERFSTIAAMPGRVSSSARCTWRTTAARSRRSSPARRSSPPSAPSSGPSTSERQPRRPDRGPRRLQRRPAGPGLRNGVTPPPITVRYAQFTGYSSTSPRR